LADGQVLFVDVGEDAASRLTVEADARDDPVVALVFLRPARGLEVDVVVPRLRIRMRSERRHDSGTDWPASTQMYSHAKLPPRARTAAIPIAAGTRVETSAMPIEAAAATIAPVQNSGAKAPRRIA